MGASAMEVGQSAAGMAGSEQPCDRGDEGDVEEEGEYEEEAEESSSDEEGDRREFGIMACLPVEPGEPDWEQEEPQSAEEYLRRVRYEARQLPDVVTAEPPPQPADRSQQTASSAPHGQGGQQQHAADQSSPQAGQINGSGSRGGRAGGRAHYSSQFLAAGDEVPACDPRLRPSAAWTKDFLRQFAQLRRRLHREHELTSGQGTAAPAGPLIAGVVRLPPGAVPVLEAAAAEELAALQLDPPSDAMPELQQLRSLDQLQVRRQLHAAIRAAVQEDSLAPEAAATLYALSARIEKPLHAGTCALYRQLLRHCSAQRAALGAAADDARLPHFNILIAISGAYFGQDEELAAMWDDDEED